MCSPRTGQVPSRVRVSMKPESSEAWRLLIKGGETLKGTLGGHIGGLYETLLRGIEGFYRVLGLRGPFQGGPSYCPLA